jgi:F-type H+-transporting ATPase subunit delta
VKDVSVAGRYAQALFILTERRKETPRALDDLRSVRDLLASDARLSAFLAAPQVRMSDKRKLLATALESRVTRVVATFVDLVLRKNRLALMAPITTDFETLVERAQGIRRAHVVSAVPLPDGERRRLHAAVEQYTKSQVKLTTEVDPAVLGGALVRIGDHVVDRTVRTLLDAIGEHLREVSV